MSKKIDIPKRIDEPIHILVWTIDVFAPTMVGMVLGVITDKMALCLGAGLIISYVYSRHRDSKPNGFLLHCLYVIGIGFCRGWSFINPYIKRFFP